ncbi:hypothetical protein N658DRAFT_307581 [Parathielavia hyrcaniae]|uniref:Uncharacterized protein n=1 Tax=Parathielavia hyrcaniae TaxID=113614 RepID=A0AAN6T319_9PEZI|nr:hypothetical protein N658DRAFT_307581 [Parathielavia hyrcaniae]
MRKSKRSGPRFQTLLLSLDDNCTHASSEPDRETHPAASSKGEIERHHGLPRFQPYQIPTCSPGMWPHNMHLVTDRTAHSTTSSPPAGRNGAIHHGFAMYAAARFFMSSNHGCRFFCSLYTAISTAKLLSLTVYRRSMTKEMRPCFPGPTHHLPFRLGFFSKRCAPADTPR